MISKDSRLKPKQELKISNATPGEIEMIKNIFASILNSFTSVVNCLYKILEPSQPPESDIDRIIRETGEYLRSLSEEELKNLLSSSQVEINTADRDKMLEALAKIDLAQKAAESIQQINIEEFKKMEAIFNKVKTDFEKYHP